MHVVATAGHVDHGKSTLVRALTGMEPDRFAEERRRGLTIDLGYAWTTLPSGRRIAFVDVPGHERFIGNMLAGIGPAPAVLFVVAADAGWSRQSEEHLAAVDALNVRHGLLAVTRADLADPGPAIGDARERLARSSLGEVPAVAVSPVTGAGLGELAAALDALVDTLPPPDLAAPVRLWLDRCFSVRGSGTVVTGTLSAGRVSVGDVLQHAGGREVTVREVQSAELSMPRVDAVARVALNLRGIARQEIGRGDVLLTPDSWHVTDAVDVELLAARQAPAELVLHVGTAALPVRLRPLGDRYARLALPRQLPLRAGDRAVLRDPGRHAVAAGVLVLDADPPPLRRRGAAAARAVALDALRALDAGDEAAVLAAEVERRGAVRRDHLRLLGVPLSCAADLPGAGDWLVAPATWRRWIEALPRQVESWRRRHPLEPAAPVAAIRRELQLPDDDLLVAVAAAAGLATAGGRIAMHDAEPRTFGAAEEGLRVVADRLAGEPFRAPERHELAELRLGRRELAAAAAAGRLLRLDDDVVLLPDAPQRAAELLRALPQPFTTSEARQVLASTRRVVIPLLELLDRLGVTERMDAAHRRIRN